MTLEPGPSIEGKRVLVVEDGPTLTHGGMTFGAGTVAARQGGAAELVDPRPGAVGSIAETLARYPQLGSVLPAMGYSELQLRELEETIDASDCDVVVTGTPFDLGRLITVRHPLRHAHLRAAASSASRRSRRACPDRRAPRWRPPAERKDTR